MLMGGYSHKNSSGISGYTCITEAGATCSFVSENINAANTSEEAVEEWVASPNHFEAMIDSRYDITGFGIGLTSYGYYFIVQHFTDWLLIISMLQGDIIIYCMGEPCVVIKLT